MQKPTIHEHVPQGQLKVSWGHAIISEKQKAFSSHMICDAKNNAHENLDFSDIHTDISKGVNQCQDCDVHRKISLPCITGSHRDAKNLHSAAKLLLRSFNFRKRPLCSSQCHA